MYSMYQSDFDTKHDFVGGEEKTLNQRQIGAALLLQKYVSLLCAHTGEILPVASSLATNGPRYCFCFVSVSSSFCLIEQYKLSLIVFILMSFLCILSICVVYNCF